MPETPSTIPAADATERESSAFEDADTPEATAQEPHHAETMRLDDLVDSDQLESGVDEDPTSCSDMDMIIEHGPSGVDFDHARWKRIPIGAFWRAQRLTRKKRQRQEANLASKLSPGFKSPLLNATLFDRRQSSHAMFSGGSIHNTNSDAFLSPLSATPGSMHGSPAYLSHTPTRGTPLRNRHGSFHSHGIGQSSAGANGSGNSNNSNSHAHFLQPYASHHGHGILGRRESDAASMFIVSPILVPTNHEEYAAAAFTTVMQSLDEEMTPAMLPPPLSI
ncbi:hypothetical protein BC831DRAFT_471121 [Entophlyctis helioformis]|nr:hypothetical protein BC831DRAFT_471121 [Entophlyctis helioformis]